MDLHSVFLVILSIAMSVIGWFARELYAATQKLRQDLSDLEVRIAENFVRHDRLQESFRPLHEQLNRIEASLIRKADKP